MWFKFYKKKKKWENINNYLGFWRRYSVIRVSLLTALLTLSFKSYSTVHAGAVIFQQFPPQIVKKGSEVQINCSHDDQNLVFMLWYQQREDRPSLTLMAYGYETTPKYEPQFEGQVTMTRQGALKGTLRIHSANLTHSAVYFCAACTQWCGLVPAPY